MLRLSLLFKRVLFAQVVLGLVTFCLSEPTPNPGLLLIVGTIAILSWYVSEGPNGKPLPRWMVNLGGLAAVSWLVFDIAVVQAHVIIALGHFIIALQILLLYGPKQNRDYTQLIMLSVLVMIGAITLSVSMITGVILVAYCILALFSILLFHLKKIDDEVNANSRKAAPPGRVAPESRPVVGRGYRWHFRLLAAGIGVSCFAVAVVVFIVMPRKDRGMFGHNLAGPIAKQEGGFSDHVNLGKTISPVARKEPVLNMRVTVGDGASRVNNLVWRLRGSALDQYDPQKHTWSRSIKSRAYVQRMEMQPGGIDLARHEGNAPLLKGQITLRNVVQNTLFTIQPTLSIDSDTIGSLIYCRSDGHLEIDESTSGAVIYAIRWSMSPRNVKPGAAPDAPAEGQPPNPDADDMTHAAQWPVETTRVRSLARSVLAQRGLDDADAAGDAANHKADAFADYLKNHYAYTLQNPPINERDPVIDFLFNRREGHCELFASAHAALCRSIGLPARVVTGYLASEYNNIGDYYVVRRGNAHAWTEVYCGPELGWLTFDATPQIEVMREQDVGDGVLSWARDLYEFCEFAWIGTVVVYDQRSRDALMENMEQSIQSAGQDQDSFLAAAIRFFRELPTAWRLDKLGYTSAGIVILMLGTALASLTRLLILRRRKLVALQLTALPRTQRRGLARKLRFYLHMLELLERYGYVRPDWQSPFSFARELAQHQPRRFNHVIRLTEIFYEVRFGHRDLDDQRRDAIKLHLRELERSLATR